MSKLNGGYAFPSDADPFRHSDKGITVRDYFAAKAMQAFITSQPEVMDIVLIAKASYNVADTMLKERQNAEIATKKGVDYEPK